jgi:hypothetical protein
MNDRRLTNCVVGERQPRTAGCLRAAFFIQNHVICWICKFVICRYPVSLCTATKRGQAKRGGDVGHHLPRLGGGGVPSAGPLSLSVLAEITAYCGL